MDGRACVCLCMSMCLHFQDQCNCVQVTFGLGSWISWLLENGPGLKTACFYKIYLLPEFVSYRVVAYLFGNLWTGARKNGELNFGVGPKILGSDFFQNLAFLTKIDYNWILRTFYVMQLFDMRPSRVLGAPKIGVFKNWSPDTILKLNSKNFLFWVTFWSKLSPRHKGTSKWVGSEVAKCNFWNFAFLHRIGPT